MFDYAFLGRNFLLELLFPKKCISCQSSGAWICPSCLHKININEKQSCPACNKNNMLGQYCRSCRGELKINGVLISADYQNNILAKSIKAYKYRFIRELSSPLSGIMLSFLEGILKEPEKNYFYPQCDKSFFEEFQSSLVIPVPLHKKRLNWRGFNQADILAEEMAREFSLELEKEGLVRTKFWRPQTSLNKEDRFKNIAGSFAWQKEKLKNKNIILIDDVCTSSATLNECAKVLKENGAKKVWGLVLANG